MAKAVKKSAKKTASETPALADNAMDYPEHEKTYELFLWLSKWTVYACVVLLLAMMLGFYGGGGLVGGTLAFIVLMIVGFFVI